MAIDLDGLEVLDFRKYKKAMIEGATKINLMRWPNPISPGSKKFKLDVKDDTYFKVENRNYVIQPHPNITPAKAIKDMKDNPENYAAECQFYCQIVKLVGMVDAMGEEEFNNYIEEQDEPFTIRAAGSTGIREDKLFYPINPMRAGKTLIEMDGTIIRNAFKAIKNMKVGTRITLESPFLSRDNIFYNENIVKVGRNKYLAQGLGEQPLTMKQILNKLVEMGGSGTKAKDIGIRQIVVTKEEDID